MGFEALLALSLYLLEALAALAFEVLPQRRLGPFGKLQVSFQAPELALQVLYPCPEVRDL